MGKSSSTAVAEQSAVEETVVVEGQADEVAEVVAEVVAERQPQVLDLREAYTKAGEIFAAFRSGQGIALTNDDWADLIHTFEALKPPAPTHEETCAKVLFEQIRANMEAKGISTELAEALIPGSMPRDCNCKVSRKRSSSATSGTRSTPVRVVPAGTAAVQYTKLDGTVVGLSCAEAATQAAADYPGAERCHAYVEQRAKGRSLNARIFLRADVDNGRIPAGIVAFAGDPAGE